MIKDGSSVVQQANHKQPKNMFENENSTAVNSLTCSVRFDGELNVDVQIDSVTLVHRMDRKKIEEQI